MASGARPKVSAFNQQAQRARLAPTLVMSDLARCEMVVEAVFESMEVKKAIFKQLDELCAPSALLCTNTSALDVDEIGGATARPHMVMGMHFFSPAHVMKLVENVKASRRAPLPSTPPRPPARARARARAPARVPYI